MRKLFILLLLSFSLSISSFAQKGLQLGANFMYLTSSIVNQNTWGLDKEYDYKFTTNMSYGLDVGYNFNDRIGVYTGFWMTNIGQSYTDDYRYEPDNSFNTASWERNVQLKYNIIPIMLKFSDVFKTVNFMGGIGVSYAMLSEAKQEWLKDGGVFGEDYENPNTGETFNIGAEDVTERFNKSDIMLNLELGARIFFIKNLYMDLSLFASYGATDINHPDWQIENNDGEYKGSHNAFVGGKVGLAYVLFGD